MQIDSLQPDTHTRDRQQRAIGIDSLIPRRHSPVTLGWREQRGRGGEGRREASTASKSEKEKEERELMPIVYRWSRVGDRSLSSSLTVPVTLAAVRVLRSHRSLTLTPRFPRHP